MSQLTKYDEKIATLYRCKISLLLKKNHMETEYRAIQVSITRLRDSVVPGRSQIFCLVQKLYNTRNVRK